MDIPATEPETFRILYVCTGNICRSPFAEILTRHLLIGRLGGSGAAQFHVASAGIRAVRRARMDPRMRHELAPWGLSGRAADAFVARQLGSSQVVKADVVLTATPRHRRAVCRLAPGAIGKTFTMRELARLIGYLDLDQLAEFSPQPVFRAQVLVDAARLVRDSAGRGGRWSDGLPDPVGESQEVHHDIAGMIQSAVATLVDAVAPVTDPLRQREIEPTDVDLPERPGRRI